MSELHKIAKKYYQMGKGILAADESTATMTKRLESVSVMLKTKKIDYFLDKFFFHLNQ